MGWEADRWHLCIRLSLSCRVGTETPGIPPTSALLKASSFESNLWVEPIDFTSNLPVRLRSLYTQ
ncbi:hypothetical protein SUBVAR_04782 [Subdoligranulum variabile DSM 15176]|uniref:Uncharacterized protein n=1 Tax=Subdoligranulum variabile DSM 15176 TaxID=411471 RepID=D1PKA9_9FIRM|nr:hypothetical protein SUBVAR_04782 [Subdoligranulum variabile DSM 15176]